MPNITSFPTGNVGIGTDNPQRNLHVAGTMRLTGSTGTGSTAIMGRDGSGDIGNVGVGTGLQLTNGTLSLTGATGTGTTGIVPRWASSSGLTDSVIFSTGTVVGINTTNPQATLDVRGTMRLTGSTGSPVTTIMGRNANGDISNAAIGTGLQLTNGTLSLTGATGTGTTNYLSKWASATGLTDSIVLETGNTIDISGSLRVRTSSGTATLIAGQDANGYFSRITVGSGLSLSGNVLTTTGSTGVSGSGTATQVAFWNGTTSLTGNTNLYWDNNNNRLGIGTSSPSNQLTTTSDALISTLTIGRGNNSIVNNTAIGVNALANNAATLASGNTAVGFQTITGNTFGGFNSAFGNLALSKTTTGNSNTAVGSDTLTNNTTGNSNTAVGRAALSNNTLGGSNVGVGSNALSNNGSGSSSVAVGASAGSLSAAGTNLTTATSSIFIGASSRASNISPSNQIVIGTSAIGLADNATVIGTTGTTQTHLYGNLTLGLTSADTTARVKATSSDGSSNSFAAKFQNSSGTDILSVRGDGVVGIGTTSPAQTLDIRGTMRLTGSTGDSTTVMGRNANGDVSAISVGSGLSLSGNTLSTTGSTGVSGSGTATQVAFWGGTSGSTSTALTSSSGLTWDNTNGRLGIGTNTPFSAFQLNVDQTLNTSFFSITRTGVSSSDGSFQINNGTSTSGMFLPVLNFTSNFNSGSSTIGSFYVSNITNTNSADIGISFQSRTKTISELTQGWIVSFANYITNCLRISHSANTVIQKGGAFTDAGYRLDVNANAATTGGLRVKGLGVATATTFLTQSSGGTNTFAILDNGNVGVNIASPTARLYVKGSTSGNGSTAFEVTDNNDRDIINVRDDGRIALGRNLASTVQSSVTIEAVGGETDINVAIVPKGTGAITAQIPDNGTTGGNARGQYALDLQRVRDDAAQVASGTHSIILGGDYNTSNGNRSIVTGGSYNVASGNYSSINGGDSNGTVGNYSSINGGLSNDASGVASSINGGWDNSASGDYSSVNGGYANVASASYSSIISGNRGYSYLYGQSTVSSGAFVTSGDAQTSNIRLRREFTGTATTELYLDGVSLQAILRGTNRIWNVRVQSVAVVTASGGTLVVGDTIAGEYGACIRRIGTTTTLISEQTKIFEHATGNMTSAVSIVISADNGTEALKVTYQPPAAAGTGTTFRVVATVYITEVGF